MASSSAALNAPAATAMRALLCRHHSQRGVRLRCIRRQEPRHEASAHGRIIIITITATATTNSRLGVEVSRQGLGVSGALGFGWEQDDGEGLM